MTQPVRPNICYSFCTALEKMLLIKILFFRWHKISPEGYKQVFTKIDKHHLCQLNNVILQNLSGLVRRSRSHIKDHRRGGVCVLRMLLGFFILPIVLRHKTKWTEYEHALTNSQQRFPFRPSFTPSNETPITVRFCKCSIWKMSDNLC